MQRIPVSVAYGKASAQCWLRLEVTEGATVGEVIEQSGLLLRFPEIDLDQQTVGIFSKPTRLDTPVAAGARVEIYQPITADPESTEFR